MAGQDFWKKKDKKSSKALKYLLSQRFNRGAMIGGSSEAEKETRRKREKLSRLWLESRIRERDRRFIMCPKR